jgi:phosphoribosylformimino-5-aminoimidazole carboxamide ribotide isomerase
MGDCQKGTERRTLIIPAIDLRNGRCVRLTQGRTETETVYSGDPIEVAKSFERAGARMIHVVDLEGAFSGEVSQNRRVLREILRAIEIPIQFGGGLRSVEDVKKVIELGVARVVIGTMAVEAPETLKMLVQMFGGDRIAVGIDSRAGQVMISGWQREATVGAVDLARRVRGVGVERIVYTDVSRDGMLTGINLESTCRIACESGLKVTASGGVSSIDDIERLRGVSEFGIDSVIVGKALYENRFTIQEALQAAERA